MSKRKPSVQKDIDALRFEEATSELEAIIDRIEQGEVELEDSLEAYRRGLALVKRCRTILDSAAKDIEVSTVEDLQGDTEDGD